MTAHLKNILFFAGLFFLFNMLISAQESAQPQPAENNTAPSNTVSSEMPKTEGDSADDGTPQPPKITPVKGGYYVRWNKLTDIGAVQIPGNMSGKLEILFDIRLEDIDKGPVKPDSIGILRPLADYWTRRGKPEHAIDLYRKGLEKEPDDFAFQNNLAYLLSAVSGQHDEALSIVNKALETRADNVTLLDTKGLIFINADKPDEAIPVLERAVTLSCQGPLYMLHLSQALDLDGRKDSASNWFAKTRPFLENASLSKENQKVFDSLKMKYGTSSE
ncbi:hypothetical protein FACS1894214_2480 [Planctomycetales bacterium]|nr:hypothetical protein FACS1894214_2480 [Planctomycetales bacterium]